MGVATFVKTHSHMTSPQGRNLQTRYPSFILPPSPGCPDSAPCSLTQLEAREQGYLLIMWSIQNSIWRQRQTEKGGEWI